MLCTRLVFEMSWFKWLDSLFLAFHLPQLNICVSWKWKRKKEREIFREMKRCVEDWESVQWAISPQFFRKWKWYQEKDWEWVQRAISPKLHSNALQLFKQSTIHQLNIGQRILIYRSFFDRFSRKWKWKWEWKKVRISEVSLSLWTCLSRALSISWIADFPKS